MTGSGGKTDSGVGWDDDALVGDWRGLPALDGDREVDACVVGLGASGLAAVAELVRRGARVVGIDGGRVAAGAAGRNGGFLIAGGADPLHRAIEQWGVEPAVTLYRETLAELDRLLGRCPPEVARRTGSVRLAGLPGGPHDEDERFDFEQERADCAAELAALHAHGFAAERYDGELGEGLFFPSDAAAQPARRALFDAGELQRSAKLCEHTPAERITAGAVETPSGRITCRAVVVAVDGRLDTLVPALDGRVRTARLQMLATAPVAPRLPWPVYARWGYDYAQQDASGHLFVGGGRDRYAEQEWTDDTQPTPDIQRYLDGVAARMAGGDVAVTHRWAASVGFTPDARPLCVAVDDGVVAVGGYSGTGNLVGPIAARAAVAYLLDGTSPPAWLNSDPVE